MRRCSAFTLIEICLAVLIALLLVSLMVPSVAGLFAERRLKNSFEEFDKFVRTAQMRSVSERRDFVMVFEDDGITLEPAEPTEEDEREGPERFLLAKDAQIDLARPVALQKNPPMEWPFWRSGTCEPVIVSYTGDAGKWVMRYDPLTVRPTTLEQLVK